jgi:hypothetical protein
MHTRIEGEWNVEAQRWSLKALAPQGRVLLITGGRGESLASCASRLEAGLIRQEVVREVVDAHLAQQALRLAQGEAA